MTTAATQISYLAEESIVEMAITKRPGKAFARLAIEIYRKLMEQ